ncbi:molybdopterin-dependent oxidoreductase [Paraburkholderia sp.]|uniref:molybdopterin-dependent oxidoreductase n=1 Tax=Paraburkholderia sp. TaxID=1926495 RepID=UPI0023A2C3ED|nr:molybdopterin-dependent oxidoreductase [Paraburkholderia sp.]MDE1182309.1 molybdopterin-dependent oxidoreductase [Paraburkholderia sp.]
MDRLDAAAVPQIIEGVVSFDGDFARPMSFSVDDLQRYASAQADPFDLRCYTTNRFIRTVDAYRGALLKDLIGLAGLRTEVPGEFKRTIFIAAAQDGYAVTFSWHELFNTPVGERVIVAYECGGKPLNAEQGAPILFSGADILPAPRHVKRLSRIVARVLAL